MESTTIEQEIAKRLLVEGATLIFLNVPVGSKFGIDMKTWDTGEKFKGIKMIPPGLHMIHYSAVGKFEQVAPRVSFIHNFQKGEFVVKKWDVDAEDMSTEMISEAEMERLKSNLCYLDQFLGVYPFDIFPLWRSLSNYITEPLVKQLSPECGLIRSALELVADEHQTVKDSRRVQRKTLEEKEEDLLPHLKPRPGTGLRLTSVPEKGYPDGCSPQEMTKHSLDLTYSLEHMINEAGGMSHLVGEIQFSFLCFLLGHSLEALESWKNLVKVLCNCREALTTKKHLYKMFLKAFEAQLDQVPMDFLVDIVASNNVIYTSLRELFRTIEESEDICRTLRYDVEKMKQTVSEKFSWDFTNLELEDEDEAPVIVELAGQV
ncbi:protein AAR2 homolog [Rhodnius prolixus]|uniref:Protein AAR2 homolog n=2 Tax=Rhodnius TaxID=13248 RepID=R4FMA7_RHOPR